MVHPPGAMPNVQAALLLFFLITNGTAASSFGPECRSCFVQADCGACSLLPSASVLPGTVGELYRKRISPANEGIFRFDDDGYFPRRRGDCSRRYRIEVLGSLRLRRGGGSVDEERGSKNASIGAVSAASADDRPSSGTSLSRRERKAQERKSDYERRRTLWESRYGSVEALRRTFGTNRNKLWGDLDPEATRRLYHTLLPRSLLGLHEAGLMKPDELAPLAYEARVAAKEYARERCILPGRVFSAAFDGYRSLRDRGEFRTKGMSWEQLWDKYEAQIVEEECQNELEGLRRPRRRPPRRGEASVTQQEEDALTTRIYLRILERSCATNRAFDRMFLRGTVGGSVQKEDEQLRDLDDIAATLESDVREILLNPREAAKAIKKAEKAEKEAEKARRKVYREERKQERKAKKAERKRQEELEKHESKEAKRSRRRQRREEKGEEMFVPSIDASEDDRVATLARPATSEPLEEHDRRRRAWSVMRILAGTRRKFRTIRG